MAIFQCISSLPNLLQWVKAASEGCCYFPRAGTGGASTRWVTEFLSSAHLLAQMCHLLGEHWPLTEGRTASTMSVWFGPRENKWVGDLATQLHIIKVGPVTITSQTWPKSLFRPSSAASQGYGCSTWWGAGDSLWPMVSQFALRPRKGEKTQAKQTARGARCGLLWLLSIQLCLLIRLQGWIFIHFVLLISSSCSFSEEENVPVHCELVLKAFDERANLSFSPLDIDLS